MSTSSRIALSCFIVAALVHACSETSPHASSASQPKVLTENIVRLAVVTDAEDVLPGSMKVSPDGDHIVYARRMGKEVVLVLDGKVGAHYVDVSVVTFSPDSSRVAFFAETPDGHCVVLDGQQGTAYTGVGFPIFSPDSRRFAHVTIRAKSGGLLTMPAGEPLAEALRRSTQTFVTVDGVEFPPVQDVAAIVFSPDSRHVAYMAQRDDQWAVFVDGTPGPFFNALAGDPVYAHNSERLAYIACTGDKYFVVADGTEGRPYDGVGSLLFSPDSKHLAYKVGKDNKTCLVVDGNEGPSFDSVGEYMFSGDSKRLAYRAIRANRHYVVLDNNVIGPYDATFRDALVFSPDSRHFAFVAQKDGHQFVVVDGVSGARQAAIGECVFSPDSKSFAYTAEREGRRFVVMDGQEGPGFDDVRYLLFAPDSAYVAYAAQERDNWFIIANGLQTRNTFDRILSLTFKLPNRLCATVARAASGVEFARAEIMVGTGE